MGQQPNIPLGVEDLPRATAKPGAPGRWAPQRPGEIGAPDEMPWGGAFGTPGPDIGFAHRVVRDMELPGELDRDILERLVVGLMTARASALGRGPTAADVVAALDLLSGEEPEMLAEVARDQRRVAEYASAIPLERLIG